MAARSTKRRIRVVWNATAGSKAGLPTNLIDEAALREALARHDTLIELAAPTSEGEAREAVRRAVGDGVDVVAAAGGDGTVALVADELIGTQVALGILPLGSAMNLARSLEIPRDLDEAVAILLDGERRPIDVGYVGERPFHEAVSVGLSAALFAEAQRIDRGQYRALGGLIHVLTSHRPAAVRIRLDEREIVTRALMVTVAIAPYTGLGLTLAPDARLDDGFLDVRIVGRFSTRELVHHFWSIAFGRRAYHPRIRTERARTVRVESRRPMPVRADDADLGTTPVEVTLRRRCLWVIAGPGRNGGASDRGSNDRGRSQG
jgi:diacylglycerol kinase (ATP)